MNALTTVTDFERRVGEVLANLRKARQPVYDATDPIQVEAARRFAAERAGVIEEAQESRGGCLGTGIRDLDAAKRYLRRRWTQGPVEPIVSRPGARFYVTAKCGGHTYALLGPYVSHMTALAAIPRAERLLAAAEVGEPDPDVSFAGMYPFARLKPFTALGTASAPVTVPTVFGR